MRLRLVVLAQADVDLDELAAYIANDSFSTAMRFYEAAEREFARLTEQPNLGSQRDYRGEALEGLRSWRIGGFENHLIFYRVTTEELQIVRVLHGARDLPAALEI